MNNKHTDELHIIEGLLIELADADLNFQLTARPHIEDGFRKPMASIRFADGSWKTKSVDMVMDALERNAELVDFTLKVTENDSTTLSGRVHKGKIIGLVVLDLTAWTAAIAEFRLGTAKRMLEFTDTARERALAIAESDRAAA